MHKARFVTASINVASCDPRSPIFDLSVFYESVVVCLTRKLHPKAQKWYESKTIEVKTIIIIQCLKVGIQDSHVFSLTGGSAGLTFVLRVRSLTGGNAGLACDSCVCALTGGSAGGNADRPDSAAEPVAAGNYQNVRNSAASVANNNK